MRARFAFCVKLALALAVMVAQIQIVRAQNGAQAAILSAIPIGGTQLAITGQNLGSDQPAVTLDDIPLAVISHTSTFVVAEYPGSAIVAAGSYHLVVVRSGNGSAANKTAALDITIGTGG